jgi:hypothetical protein
LSGSKTVDQDVIVQAQHARPGDLGLRATEIIVARNARTIPHMDR